ncbi:hypothetical protein [Actinomadura rupiterrae]|uniref:hypothetical protein n=1 Tax=Actinomadura rupiterrae TaxID=559627 RepID=UPI0020A28426|nr:hypothetical protein [Actinomadura rupiterrae]MCP2336886.1 hypothetical protein [Actinomadura rupiterrae]
MPKPPVVQTVLFGLLTLAFLSWPTGVAYTLLAGERATAHVAECHTVSKGRGTSLACTGTWRTPDGRGGSGDLYNLDRDEAGHDVAVRSGPFGLYAHGFGRAWPHLLFSLFGPVLFGARFVGLLARVRALRREERTRLAGLAREGAIIVTRDLVRTAEGRTLVAAVRSAAGRLCLDGPDGTTLVQFEGDGPWTLYDRDGSPLGSLESELGTFLTHLATPSSTPDPPDEPDSPAAPAPPGEPGSPAAPIPPDEAGLLMSAVDGSGYALTDPSGTPLARFAPDHLDGRPGYAVRDAADREIGSLYREGDEWIIRFPDVVQARLRNAAITFALIQARAF